MGYPIEKIDKETQLFVYVGPNAIEEGRDELFNRHFKEENLNKKMMGINIKEEDLPFFIQNFKHSKIQGAYFAQPFWELLPGLLDDMSVEARSCGAIDSIMIEEGEYVADLTFGRVAAKLIASRAPIEGKRVAIVGATPLSKTLLWHLRNENPDTIVLMDPIVEKVAELDRIVEKRVPTDIGRIRNKEAILSDVDIVIDALCAYKPQYWEDVHLVVTLRDHPCDLYRKGDVEWIRFDEIFAEIARTKTKKWRKHA